MQDFPQSENNNQTQIDYLSVEDRQKLVSAFVWLMKEDKKQNPALYQNNVKQDD